MKDPIQQLREDLIRAQDLLVQGEFFSFSPEEKQSLVENARQLLHKLDTFVGTSLTVGLVGGTGVGKSTLMNALAGSEIASTSHRRPHTHEVLIYRHSAVPLPPALQTTSAPWHEFTHEVDSVRQVLLCDLPDFDSLVRENRQRVVDFLEHLDVLVWVTSPEKYADAKFYDFLRSVPKAKQNFYFVLNKGDILLAGDETSQPDYEQQTRVIERFREHIRENGITDPTVYILSAREAEESSSFATWNQFPSFRHHIFQERDAKEITAIKAANLDVEVRELLSIFEQEALKLKVLDQVLGDFIERIERERPEWVQAGRTTLDLWLTRHMKDEILSQLADASPLVGPAYGLAALAQATEKWTGKKGENRVDADCAFLPPQDISLTLKQQMERVENRMINQFLSRGLPSPMIKRFNEVFDVGKKWEDLAERLRTFLEMRFVNREPLSFRGFRVTQYVIYLLIFLFFLLGLAGDIAWRNLSHGFHSVGLIEIFFVATQRLFSPPGLAALGSYAVLNLFFGFRFYNRYKKLLQQRSQQIIESLKTEAGKIWEEELDGIIKHLTRYRHELNAQMSTISVLQEIRTGK